MEVGPKESLLVVLMALLCGPLCSDSKDLHCAGATVVTVGGVGTFLMQYFRNCANSGTGFVVK